MEIRHADLQIEVEDAEDGGGLVVWLMAVIVICLAPAMHPIAADIAVLSITAYAIRTHSRN